MLLSVSIKAGVKDYHNLGGLTIYRAESLSQVSLRFVLGEERITFLLCFCMVGRLKAL